jgi:hypothetical protein
LDHSPSPSLALSNVTFVSELSEVRAAMVPITGRSWISRLFRLNRNEDILDASNHRVNEARQRYMVCQQYFVFDFGFGDDDWYPQGWYCHSDKSRGISAPETYRRQPRMPPSLITILPTRSFQLTEYSKPSPFAFNRLILIPGYSSGLRCTVV